MATTVQTPPPWKLAPPKLPAPGLGKPPPGMGKPMVPVGGVGVPGPVSVTVAVQLVGWVGATVAGAQLTLVVVGRCCTVRVVLPWLGPWAGAEEEKGVVGWGPTGVGGE